MMKGRHITKYTAVLAASIIALTVSSHAFATVKPTNKGSKAKATKSAKTTVPVLEGKYITDLEGNDPNINMAGLNLVSKFLYETIEYQSHLMLDEKNLLSTQGDLIATMGTTTNKDNTLIEGLVGSVATNTTNISKNADNITSIATYAGDSRALINKDDQLFNQDTSAIIANRNYIIGDQKNIATDQTNILANRNYIIGDQAAIKTDQGNISANRNYIIGDQAAIKTDQGNISANRNYIIGDQAAIKTDQSNIAANRGYIIANEREMVRDQRFDDRARASDQRFDERARTRDQRLDADARTIDQNVDRQARDENRQLINESTAGSGVDTRSIEKSSDLNPTNQLEVGTKSERERERERQLTQYLIDEHLISEAHSALSQPATARSSLLGQESSKAQVAAIRQAVHDAANRGDLR